MLGLRADSRRSFPGTQLAFSIWVPGPLLTPYSQNTHSNHRNPSNSQHIRAAQLMASLSAQPTGCLLVKRVSQATTSLFCPTAPDVLLVKRISQASTSLSAQPTGCSARVTGITGLDKPICPTARTHLAPNGYSQTEYHRPLLQKSRRRTKLSLGSSVRRPFMPVLYSGISIQCLNLQPSGMVSGSLSK